MQELRLANAGKIPYIYITGASYCGSTLLAFLLNAHPHMVSISEGHRLSSINLDKYACSCGALVLQCPFFTELEKRINALGTSFNLRNWGTNYQLSHNRLLNTLLVRPLGNAFLEQKRDLLIKSLPGYQKAINRINVRNLHFAQAMLDVSNKKVVVDAQKDSMRIKFLNGINELDLFVIHLVRDVRGGVASFMKNNNTNDPVVAIKYWVRQNMNSERAKRYVHSSRWLRITYDKLCSDKQGVMNHISDFVGVPRVTMTNNYYEVEHHILGNRMRMRRSNEVVLDESWKDRLTQNDLDVIARIAGDNNRYFGHNWP